MTYNTNDASWKAGYSGHQTPYGASPSVADSYRRGQEQLAREQQAKADAAAKAMRERATKK
ncbi:hypothetical protein [Phaeobacter piscinae]|uniref:Uncharacterized protein n=1 Tax=Phaeobacter piscinae TaxID=1580596 RepID=A0AAN1GR51_9RHOB|nr:hypothetical protein [Phaeobacter piscinae]ATG43648.1 hypothetical protein PhaeoP13_01711 [Phaeobacter piscinae]